MSDIDQRIKHFLHGLVVRPHSDAELEAIRAFRERRGLDDVVREEEPMAEVREPLPPSTPVWIGDDGKPMPPANGAYMRMKTLDALVEVITHRPKKNGDFDQTIKVYGPFETADKQREFMRSAWRATFPAGARLDAALAAVDNWCRFDEED